MFRKGFVEIVEHLMNDGVKEAETYIRKSETMKVTDEELPEVCQELSEAALVINDLKRHRNSEYTFKFDKIFKKNSKTFYLHVRFLAITLNVGLILGKVCASMFFD